MTHARAAIGLAALALGLGAGLAALPGPRRARAQGASVVGESDPGPVASAVAGDRIVLATGPLEGTLEPCRCTEGMLGGLPRRASLVARWAAAHPLVLDLGDLAKTDAPTEELLEVAEAGALDALATIGVETSSAQAIAFGCTEARLGLERLARLSGPYGGKLVWVATNVVPRSARRTFLRPSLAVGDVTVLAVLEPGLATPPDGADVLAPADAIRAELARLPREGRRVLVLYHGEAASAERDLGEVPGIDVILCGHAEHAEPTRRLASGAALVTLETKGQRLRGLALAPAGTAAAGLRAEASHDLDALVPDARAAREALDRLYEQETALVPDMPRKHLDEAGGTYVGSETCRECHAGPWEVFAASRHAHALERLREKDPKRSGLAECLRCHTVGFGYESGFSQDTHTPALDAVGCESCHGPGSNHVAKANGGEDPSGFGRPAGKWPLRWRARCLVCHDPANSPGFALEPYLEKIRHWKDAGRKNEGR